MLKADCTRCRTDVDNASSSLLAHHRQSGLHREHHAVKICGEKLLEFFGRQLFKIPKQTVTCIIYQNINAPEFFDGFGYGCFRLCLVGYVQLDKSDVLTSNIL